MSKQRILTLASIVSDIQTYVNNPDVQLNNPNQNNSILFEAYTTDNRAVRFQISKPNDNLFDLLFEVIKLYAISEPSYSPLHRPLIRIAKMLRPSEFRRIENSTETFHENSAN